MTDEVTKTDSVTDSFIQIYVVYGLMGLFFSQCAVLSTLFKY